MSSSTSSALVPYHSTVSSYSSPSHPSVRSLIPASYFTTQTAHALATDLLYRLLYDLLNRLLITLHRCASQQVDNFSSFVEHKVAERKSAQHAKEEVQAGQLRITEEVGRAAARRGFWGPKAREGVVCPMTGEIGGLKGPPGWVGSVLKGVEEGRFVEGDFWEGLSA